MQSAVGAANGKNNKLDDHDKESCPFCPDGNEDPKSNKLTNDSQKLGDNCTDGDTLGGTKPGKQQYGIIYKNPDTSEEDISPVSFQAHHCIPGNASLKGEKYKHKILKYIEESKNHIMANIGYDVNNKDNGVWLCNKPDHFIGSMDKSGNWIVYPESGMKWGALSKKHTDKQYAMAKASMLESERQFHDSHGEYSERVRDHLDEVMDEIKESKTQCPIEKGNKKPNIRPPVGLIYKLNSLSETLAEMLVGDRDGWVDPYFTSKFSKKLAEEPKE